MADSRVSEFPSVTSVVGTEEILCVQDNDNKTLTPAQILEYTRSTGFSHNPSITDGVSVDSILFDFSPTTNGAISSLTLYNGINVSLEYSDSDNANGIGLSSISNNIIIKSSSGDLGNVWGIKTSATQEYGANASVNLRANTGITYCFGSNNGYLMGATGEAYSVGDSEKTITISSISGSLNMVDNDSYAANSVINITNSIGTWSQSVSKAYNYSGCSVSVTNNYGVLCDIGCSKVSAGSATITNNYGVFVKNNVYGEVSNGTITNHYGIYLDSFAVATNEWGVYSIGSAAKNYFNGPVTIGTTSASAKVHVVSTTEQLRLGYDANNYVAHTVDSSGNVLIDAVGVVKIGGSSNYAQIGTDGTITLVGTATAFDDLLIEMKESLKGSGTKPDWDATNLGFLFPQNNVTEIIYLNVQLPHRWKEGSTIYPHIHFFQDQNVTPTFKLDYRWVNIGDSVPSFTTGYTMNSIVGEQTWTTGLLHRVVTNTGGLSGSGKSFSSMLQIKLYRDDNTYSGDCLVTSFDIHFEIDSFGTSSEYQK